MNYKLSDYAKKFNVTYRTAWNRFKKGKIEGAFLDETNHVIIPLKNLENNKKVAIYSRVSNNDRKDNLERQSERLINYAISNGYEIIHNIKEIGSGLNDNRKGLIKLLKSNDYSIIIVENKDRLTRFGFNYIETLLNINNKKIIVVNRSDDGKIDLIEDLTSIIYSFSARMYGLRKKKNKEEIVKFLEQ
jgi:predicted site-specific integrase-resolvase